MQSFAASLRVEQLELEQRGGAGTDNSNERYDNGFIITWILHQIIVYSNKVTLG